MSGETDKVICLWRVAKKIREDFGQILDTVAVDAHVYANGTVEPVLIVDFRRFYLDVDDLIKMYQIVQKSCADAFTVHTELTVYKEDLLRMWVELK